MKNTNLKNTIIIVLVFAGALLVVPGETYAQERVCRDSILQCFCSNGEQICDHQTTNCNVLREAHNEMPGAAACRSELERSSTVSAQITSPSATTIYGVGAGAPGTPEAISTQTTTDSTELPKTGLPLAAIALAGLAPLGMKLKAFTSKFSEDDPNTIWTRRQLEK